MALLVSPRDTVGLLSMDDAIGVIEDLYTQSCVSQRLTHAPVRLPIPCGSLRIVAGALLKDEVMGARIGSASGLVGDSSPIALFDTNSGNLLAIMPAPGGTLRVGATVGLAVKWLSPAKSSTAAVLGAGRNSMSVMKGLAAVRELREIRVFSRNADRRQAAARRANDCIGPRVRAMPTSDEAVDRAEIVACVTNSDGPVFDPSLPMETAHVSSVGSVNEVPDETYSRAVGIFVGSKQQEEQFEHYHSFDGHAPRHALRELARGTTLDWASDVQDLGAGMPGKWRPAKIGQTVFKDSRGGIGDVALAAAVYRKVREVGRGTEFDLGYRESDATPLMATTEEDRP